MPELLAEHEEAEEKIEFVVEVFRTYVATLKIEASSEEEAKKMATDKLVASAIDNYEHCEGLDDVELAEREESFD